MTKLQKLDWIDRKLPRNYGVMFEGTLYTSTYNKRSGNPALKAVWSDNDLNGLVDGEIIEIEGDENGAYSISTYTKVETAKEVNKLYEIIKATFKQRIAEAEERRQAKGAHNG